MQLRECISIICSPGEGALLDWKFAMQLCRCITRGFCNYSEAPPFHLLRVWDITVERVLEMSERVTYSRVSHCSKSCSRSLQSLSCQALAPSHIPALEISVAVLLLSGSRWHTSALEISLAHLASPHARTPSLTLPLLTSHTLPLLSRSAHLASPQSQRRAASRNAEPGDTTPSRETQRREGRCNAMPRVAAPSRESQRCTGRRNAAPRVTSPWISTCWASRRWDS
jgi:hypothetical protein